jgi:hypothetical protein
MASGDGGSKDSDEGGLKSYVGFLVVTIAVVAVLVAMKLTLDAFTPKDGIPTSTDVTAVLGVVTTAISGLAGAFFGISLGQQGKAKADEKADEAQTKAQVYAQFLDPAKQPDVAAELQRLGL